MEPARRNVDFDIQDRELAAMVAADMAEANDAIREHFQNNIPLDHPNIQERPVNPPLFGGANFEEALQAIRFPVSNVRIQAQERIVSNNVVTQGGIHIVSSLYRCHTVNCNKLCIINIVPKLKREDNYDIGGTYNEQGLPEYWFYFTTSMCPKRFYLISLFVYHRKSGNFSIGIPKGNELQHKSHGKHEEKESTFTSEFTWNTYRTIEESDHHYIKTFTISQSDFLQLENSIVQIPMKIINGSQIQLNEDFIRSIKLKHDLHDLLSKQENTDFILESKSGKEYPVHKIIVAAHSSVLRSKIERTSNKIILDIEDSQMDCLVEYLYSGIVKDMLKQDCMKLLEVAVKFELKPLFNIVQYMLEKQLRVVNAVEIAVLAKKYNLTNLLVKVFDYINNNPDVFKTPGWADLTDIHLMKCLFAYTHSAEAKPTKHA